MISDPDILRAAQLVFERHGESAAAWANRRRKQLLIGGGIEASELWRQIVEAVEEMERETEERK